MATTNPTMAIERMSEVRHLAKAIYAEADMDWATALRQADRQIDELLRFAADWDAQAEPEPTPPAPAAPVYIPSALEPHEARAVDKALYMRASGIVPQLVGRFWFVPSRTTGGVIYRTTPDSCTCEAFEHGGLCWHRCLIGLEHELAA